MSKKARAESKRQTKLNLKKAKRARVSFLCLYMDGYSCHTLGLWCLGLERVCFEC